MEPELVKPLMGIPIGPGTFPDGVQHPMTALPMEALTEEQKAQKLKQEGQYKEEMAKIHKAKKTLKELHGLFLYLESQRGNRVARRQFRRDFINNGQVMNKVVIETMEYYDKIEKNIEEVLGTK